MPAPSTPADLTFVGNATTLLRYRGLTVLTDPNFLRRGQYAYLGRGALSRRRQDPALRIEDLPPVDLVVLSHLHGDHWDRVARRNLPHALHVVTTPAAAKRLHRQGFTRATGLDTWDTYSVPGPAGLTATALPGQHGVGLARVIAPPPVMGSLLEFPATPGHDRRRIYISGDTLVFGELRAVAERYPDIDLALLHLGGTKVLGLLLTMDAEQGVTLLEMIRPTRAVPIHLDDYGVMRSPPADFRRAVAAGGLADRVRFVARGETVPLFE